MSAVGFMQRDLFDRGQSEPARRVVSRTDQSVCVELKCLAGEVVESERDIMAGIITHNGVFHVVVTVIVTS